jgi:hypothetical protein
MQDAVHGEIASQGGNDALAGCWLGTDVVSIVVRLRRWTVEGWVVSTPCWTWTAPEPRRTARRAGPLGRWSAGRHQRGAGRRTDPRRRVLAPIAVRDSGPPTMVAGRLLAYDGRPPLLVHLPGHDLISWPCLSHGGDPGTRHCGGMQAVSSCGISPTCLSGACRLQGGVATTRIVFSYGPGGPCR